MSAPEVIVTVFVLFGGILAYGKLRLEKKAREGKIDMDKHYTVDELSEIFATNGDKQGDAPSSAAAPSSKDSQPLSWQEEQKIQRIMRIFEEIGTDKVKAMSKEEFEELADDIEISFIIEERCAKEDRRTIPYEQYHKQRMHKSFWQKANEQL
jgi:hypothetical protein